MFLLYLNALEDNEDKAFIIKIYENYSKSMGAYANKLLKNHQLAEDAVQQTFVKLINNISTLKKLANDKIKPYIFIALRNIIFDMTTENKKYYLDDALDEVFHINTSFENEVIDKIQTQYIIQEINKLPENDITILQLTYLIQLKDSQIAKQLDISVSAVRKRRERAKEKLCNQIMARRLIGHGN